MQYGTIKLTQGNINNHHLYLASIMDLFPHDSIGGGSKATRASRLLEIRADSGDPTTTDIAGDKKIFRKRGWVRKFFATHKLKAGDTVVVERTGPYQYHVYPKRKKSL